MTRSVEVFVPGKPISQGSKTCICRGTVPVMFETLQALGPWRTKIRQAVRSMEVTWMASTPLEVELDFVFRQTAARSSGWKQTAPDIDKLARAVLDAITKDAKGRGLLPDDSQVVSLIATKRHGLHPGVHIRVHDAPSPYSAVPLFD